MKREPNFEELIKTLKLKKSSRIPLIELGIHPIIKEAILGHPLSGVKDEIEFMRMMGYDFVKIQPIIRFEMDYRHSDKEMVVDRNWAPGNKGIITSIADIENYPWPKVSDIDYSRFEEAKKFIPDGMGIIGQYGDLFTVAWELMGFENFAMATYENPELIKLLMDKVAEIILSMFKTMSDMDFVGAIWFSDDIAYANSLMMSPDFYREFFFPYMKQIGDFAKLREIPYIYHTDGLLWDVFDDIIDCGVTAIHPIEPKAMDIRDVQKKYGDKLCLCGGIEVDVLARGSEEEVKNLTLKLINEVGVNGGWCAGSSNSVPDYVPVKNYLTMVNTLIENGNL